MKPKQKLQNSSGFSIIELMVSIGIFALLLVGVLASVGAINRATKVAREKTVLSSLASNYLEVVRNMPYADIGVINGNPVGNLPDSNNAYSQKIEATVYNIYYEAFYIDDPSDGTAGGDPDDLSPTDYKQVKMSILNTDTGVATRFLTNVVPEGSEGVSNTGTLSIKVVNAQGLPVPDANIHIQYPTSSPFSLSVDRTSDSSGDWVEVGLTPAVNNYRIVVTKEGYSSDQTYPITAANPNPTKPDATVQVGVVTQITFSIDLLSNLTVRTVDQYCANINGVGVNVVGAKLIGTDPDVAKFAQLYYSGPAAYPNGQIDLNDIEWDTYTPTLAPLQPYTVVGTSPVQKIDVMPNTSQVFTMYLSTESTGISLLVIVKDAITGAPLEGAQIHLHKGGSEPQDYFGTSGGSVWQQSDWIGGAGSDNWSPSQPNTYYQTTGSIYINSGNGSNSVELQKNVGNNYVVDATSTLESSAFDTGSNNSSFTTLSWEPTSQDPNTFLGFQIATNNDNLTWDFKGPDGTEDTYYTVPGSGINSLHDNSRYVRYKLFLSTSDHKKTPVLSSLVLNYVSGCFAPGQFFFPNLTPSEGSAWDISVVLPGYEPYFLGWVEINNGFNPPLEILMMPQ